MFKKLSELLFGEVEEEIEVSELKKPVEKTNHVKVADKPIEHTKQKPIKKEKTKDGLEKAPAKKEKPIFIDSSQPKKTDRKKYHKKESLVETKPIEYEFTPVISPMRGVQNEEGMTVKLPKKRKSTPTKASSRLGTVLSPYHGLGKGKNPQELPEAKPLDEEIDSYDHELREEEEAAVKKVEELSLDEILIDDEPNLFTTAELHLKEEALKEESNEKVDDQDELSQE